MSNDHALKLYQLDDLVSRASTYPLITSGIGTLHNCGLWFLQQIAERTAYENTRQEARDLRLQLANHRILCQEMINDLQRGDAAKQRTYERCRFNNIFVARRLRDGHPMTLGDATLSQLVAQMHLVTELFLNEYHDHLQAERLEEDPQVAATLSKVDALFTQIETALRSWTQRESGLGTLTWSTRTQPLRPPPPKSDHSRYHIATAVTPQGLEYCQCLIPQSGKEEMREVLSQILYCTGIGEDKVQVTPVLCTAAHRQALEEMPEYTLHTVYLGRRQGVQTRGQVYFHQDTDISSLQTINVCLGVVDGAPAIQQLLVTARQAAVL